MMDDNEDKVPRQCSIRMRTVRHVLLCVQTCTVNLKTVILEEEVVGNIMLAQTEKRAHTQ